MKRGKCKEMVLGTIENLSIYYMYNKKVKNKFILSSSSIWSETLNKILVDVFNISVLQALIVFTHMYQTVETLKNQWSVVNHGIRALKYFLKCVLI